MRTQKIVAGLLVVVSVGLPTQALAPGSREKPPAATLGKKAVVTDAKTALVIQL